VTLPDAMSTLNSAVGIQVSCLDDSASTWYYGSCIPSSGTVIRPRSFLATGTYVNSTGVTAAVPFTWAVNDLIVISGTYRAS
jgi:hypothetical protein